MSELLWLDDDRLLVLERGSATTKIYCCVLGEPLDDQHLDITARPTLEELSADSVESEIPTVKKKLLFSSDDHADMSSDLEGMILVSPSQLLLVSDNDFGVDGAETAFWRVSFESKIS